MCGGLSKFIGKRYNITCDKCESNRLTDKIERAKSYYTLQRTAEIVKKTKQTTMERYGRSIVNQYYNKDSKEKYEEKCIKKWGVKNPSQSKEVKEKFRQTCIERYGVPTNLNINSAGRTKRIWDERHDEIINKTK